MKLGELIQFKMASLNGDVTRAGRVTKMSMDGRVEVRLQLGGYHVLAASEVIDPAKEDAAEIARLNEREAKTRAEAAIENRFRDAIAATAGVKS